MKQPIRNRKLFNRAVIFEGCSSKGGLTDIDAVYDVKGKALVLIEVKHEGTSITVGQKILFDRMVQWCSKPTYAITAWEKNTDNSDIILKDAIVKEVRVQDPKTGKAVVKPVGNYTVKEVIEYIEGKYNV